MTTATITIPNKMKIFMSLIWICMMCLEIVGFDYVDTDQGKATGQGLMVLFAGINATFWFILAYMPEFLSVHKIISSIFLGTHVIYLLLWLFSQGWLPSEARPGFSFNDMNTWAKIHSISMIFILIITLYLTYTVLILKATTAVNLELLDKQADLVTKQADLVTKQADLDKLTKDFQAKKIEIDQREKLILTAQKQYADLLKEQQKHNADLLTAQNKSADLLKEQQKHNDSDVKTG
jgi:hypothetical protein